MKLNSILGMIVDDQQSFDGLVNHLKHAFQLGETVSELISDFYGCHQKKNESRMPLQMTSRLWSGKSLPANHPSGQRQMSSCKTNMPISCMTNIMQ